MAAFAVSAKHVLNSILGLLLALGEVLFFLLCHFVWFTPSKRHCNKWAAALLNSNRSVGWGNAAPSPTATTIHAQREWQKYTADGVLVAANELADLDNKKKAEQQELDCVECKVDGRGAIFAAVKLVAGRAALQRLPGVVDTTGAVPNAGVTALQCTRRLPVVWAGNTSASQIS